MPISSTSNCPPLVAMSVVTRWRSTFSSSVTHLTVMSGFLAVNSLVNPCMRTMSPLFTVAMVRVVCASAGAEANRESAPSRAPENSFTVSSQIYCIGHMPMHWAYVHIGPKTCQGGKCRDPRICLVFSPRSQRGCARSPAASLLLSVKLDVFPRAARVTDPENRSPFALAAQNRAGSRLIGDQPVDQPAL